MKTIHARQIQLTKMRIRKTKKVLYILYNIFSHQIAHMYTVCLVLYEHYYHSAYQNAR